MPFPIVYRPEAVPLLRDVAEAAGAFAQSRSYGQVSILRTM